MSLSRKHFLYQSEVIVFIIITTFALCFAAYTSHAWEDYYITYRVSQNLATGQGLVYTIGQRVHAFSSPLGVLIPAFLNFVTGNVSDALVLWLFRLISVTALASAAVMMLKVGRYAKFGLLPLILITAMPIIDAKTVDFTINGMETGLAILFIALTIYFLIIPSKAAIFKLGIAWTGLMWTRPDGFVYIGALALGFLLFHQPNIANTRKGLIIIYLKAAAVTAILYSPWFIWAWLYYGSPIPNTIIAKALYWEDNFINHFKNIQSYPNILISNITRLKDPVFLPSYFGLGGWPIVMRVASLLSIICAFYWLLPFARPSARAVSFAFLTVHIYLNSVAVPSPWYLPNLAFLGFFIFSQIVDHSLTVLTKRKLQIVSLVAAIIFIQGTFLLLSAYQLRIQQKIIEEETRKQIGLWLQDNATSQNDTVFLEPLGYIGFYSQLKMYDFYGLASPEVIYARKLTRSGENISPAMVRLLRPNWLVLRPQDLDYLNNMDQSILAKEYIPTYSFDANPKLKPYNWIPGKEYLLFDSKFFIFKRSEDIVISQPL